MKKKIRTIVNFLEALFLGFMLFWFVLLLQHYLNGAKAMTPEFYELYITGFAITMIGVGIVYALMFSWAIYLFRKNEGIRNAILIGGVFGLISFLSGMTFVFMLAAGPAVSDISLCWAFRPWWRSSNWVFALIPSKIIGLIFFGAAIGSSRSRKKTQSGEVMKVE